jgi:hypothetical protein
VSALTDPVVVIVVKDMPVPAATDVTVPLPFAAMLTFSESTAFCTLALVAIEFESAMSVPVDVIVPPDRPNPVATDVTVPVKGVVFRMTPSLSVVRKLIGDAVESIVRILVRPFTSNGWVGEGVEMPTSLVVA